MFFRCVIAPDAAAGAVVVVAKDQELLCRGFSTAGSGYPNTTVNSNRGAFRQEGRSRRDAERLGEFRTVQFGRVAEELRPAGLPQPPGDMLHAIFETAAVALPGIPPIVLGDEFFERARRCQGRLAGDLHPQAIPI